MNFKSKKYCEKNHQRALREVRSTEARLRWLAQFRCDAETPRWLIKWQQISLALERKFGIDPLQFQTLPPESRPTEVAAFRQQLIKKYVEPLALS